MFTKIDTLSPSTTTSVRSFFNRTYTWMGAGLSLTAIIAFLTARNEVLLGTVMDNVLMLVLVQLGIVFGLGFLLNRVSASVASVLFMLYAGLNGLTFATLSMRYAASDITAAFVISAGMFGAMSLIGYTTRRDLSKYGSILLMALIGLIVAMLVNLFLQSTLMVWITSVIGVLLFSALTAYDTQKLREMALGGVDAASETGEKLAVYGALTLYLDFINMFLFVLRIFGLTGSNRD
ncbi:Bax inhibitor-1/YccA family protein [Deinococcus peraridilitoris]|uniref:FtsH-interacting integral membrane protein n=1 Tax=Deinococcus peraridilitoris (strain DSM 19664 / LMG 22246 / CIP 109416 / KR-200) TaxID=937777 RepID=L0A6E1_DEIPD|nr:Bax inhibitor-1/YccA family protein [Deinococcus peraridilitoris]AFZ69014.1 FtsH-interacting integral membrane protein [Deinococcus peraridilitoris DSM 19664]